MKHKMHANPNIDSEADRLLNELTARSGKSRADVIREALVLLSKPPNTATSEVTPYELATDLIGVAEGGPKDLACRHKSAFCDLLEHGRTD